MRADFDGAFRTLLVRVRGTVQGVGYRAACVRYAQSLAVTGWVRNRTDGSVEALLQGAGASVSQMCDWMADGMPAALVSAGQVASSVVDLKCDSATSEIARIFSRLALVRIG